MVIFCDKVQAPSDFSSSTTSCRCFRACASVWTNFGWPVPPRVVSELEPLALLLSSRCTNQNFCLVTSNMRLGHIDARIVGVLVNTLYVGDTSPANRYMLCAMGQCGLLGFPCRTSTSLATKLTSEVRSYPEIREGKVKCQPLSNCQSPRHGRPSPPAARRSPSDNICQLPRA